MTAGDSGGENLVPGVIGVLGAGTMGAGIAQLAARAGAETLLYDPIEAALEAGLRKARDGPRQGSGPWTPERTRRPRRPPSACTR